MTDSQTAKRRRIETRDTLLKVDGLSTHNRSNLLEWLVEDDKHTNVLSHIRRFFHRCHERDCTWAPKDDKEIRNTAEQTCNVCDDYFCTTHFEDLSLACANLTCPENDRRICDSCRRYECDFCNAELCNSCSNKSTESGLMCCDECAKRELNE